MNQARSATVAFLVLIAGTSSPAQEALVPGKELRALDGAAKRLAKCGLERDAVAVIDVLQALGYPERSLKMLETTCNKEFRKTKHAKFKPAPILKDLGTGIEKVLAFATTATGDKQKAIARQVLALDARLEPAHEMLGHVRSHGRWIEPWMQPLLDREVEMHQALAKALTLEVEPSRVTQSDDVLLESTLGRLGTLAEGWNITIHTSLSREAARQVMIDYARASAFANFLLHGEVKPLRPRPFQFLLVESRAQYDKLIEVLSTKGRMPADEASYQKTARFFWDPRNEFFVMHARDSEHMSALLLSESLDRMSYRGQQFIRGGLANYVCLAALGRRLPYYTKPGQPANASIDEKPPPKLLRAQSGLIGLQAYLADQVQRGTDRPWRNSFVGKIGELDRDDLFKSTGMMWFACTRGPIDSAFSKCPETDATDRDSRTAQFEEAFGVSVDELEKNFHTWIRGATPSILERVEARANSEVDKNVRKMLSRLNKMRGQATESKDPPNRVGLNSWLDRGASDHARYLGAMAAPPKTWQEGCVQDPKQKEFSVGGLRAGVQSLVALGAASPDAALDQWFATFYDRIDLLHPGLLDVGLAQSDTTCVLDCRSLVARPEGEFVVRWPYDKMKNVPLAYQQELRDPVPKATSREWGYPVTLQILRDDESPAGEIEMQLFLGNPSKKQQIECYVSTPDSPSNPQLSPHNTYALIPKAPLKARSTYTVVATYTATKARLIWTFKT